MCINHCSTILCFPFGQHVQQEKELIVVQARGTIRFRQIFYKKKILHCVYSAVTTGMQACMMLKTHSNVFTAVLSAGFPCMCHVKIPSEFLKTFWLLKIKKVTDSTNQRKKKNICISVYELFLCLHSFLPRPEEIHLLCVSTPVSEGTRS